MFKLQSLQSTLHLMQYTYWDSFSTAQNSFWTCRFWCLLSVSAHWQNISFWGRFSSRQIRKVAWSEVGWIGRAGDGDLVIWSKTAEKSAQCWQMCSQITHHEMSQWVGRVFKKNSPKLNAASHNNASWYTDTDRILEHSPGWGTLYYNGPALQKVILDFLRSSLI